MAAAAILKYQKIEISLQPLDRFGDALNRYISTTVRPIYTKFGMVTHNQPPKAISG